MKQKETRQITFMVNEQTLELIGALKKDFNVNTTADVLRRALALARVATENAGADNTLTIIDRNNERHKIMLAG